MKRYIITFCVALMALVASAQQGMTVLQLHLNDGTVDKYILHDKPVVTFGDGNLIVTSDKATNTYVFSTVEHFDFEEASSGVGSVTAEENTFTVCVDGNTLSVAADELQWVELYTVNGTKAMSADAVDGVAEVDLSSLPAGVYVVATNCHKAIKILKK
ncbi:MAG: T9SS type A sorting domain-containing protein [Muribaculaceae bacterium]|nr:T9SS type A sorting domain-containing protein [Muribaculaceae bacterium]